MVPEKARRATCHREGVRLQHVRLSITVTLTSCSESCTGCSTLGNTNVWLQSQIDRLDAEVTQSRQQYQQVVDQGVVVQGRLERSEEENARLLELSQKSEQTQRERLDGQLDEARYAAQEREHALNTTLVELETRLRESGAALERSREESARLLELYQREQTQRERLDGQLDEETTGGAGTSALAE